MIPICRGEANLTSIPPPHSCDGGLDRRALEVTYRPRLDWSGKEPHTGDGKEEDTGRGAGRHQCSFACICAHDHDHLASL